MQFNRPVTELFDTHKSILTSLQAAHVGYICAVKAPVGLLDSATRNFTQSVHRQSTVRQEAENSTTFNEISENKRLSRAYHLSDL